MRTVRKLAAASWWPATGVVVAGAATTAVFALAAALGGAGGWWQGAAGVTGWVVVAFAEWCGTTTGARRARTQMAEAHRRQVTFQRMHTSCTAQECRFEPRVFPAPCWPARSTVASTLAGARADWTGGKVAGGLELRPVLVDLVDGAGPDGISCLHLWAALGERLGERRPTFALMRDVLATLVAEGQLTRVGVDVFVRVPAVRP